MKTVKERGRKAVSLKLPESLVRAVKERADDERRTQHAVFVAALEQYLATGAEKKRSRKPLK